MKGEIFEEFIRLAYDQGLVKSAAEKEKPEPKKEKSSVRETAEILYGVKPNGEDDDVLDKAHPKPVIIAPSYDKMNGLVENLKERQKVMIDMARKPPNGILSHKKYAQAHNELLTELIQIGFEMDRKDIDDLRALADSCSEKLVDASIIPVKK